LGDLCVAKDNIVHSLVPRDVPATCAQVVYAVFKTHNVIAVYVAQTFENHLLVSTEYVKFLATHSGSKRLENCQIWWMN
jgi:hypothetical protein